MVLKFLYSLFLGVLFASLVGLGIAAFYPQPKVPEYPSSLNYAAPVMEQTERQQIQMQRVQARYNSQLKTYETKRKLYSRDVSIIALIAAIIVLVISLTYFKQLLLLSDGLLLGGLLTLIYSIFRGFETDDNMFRFIVVAVGFITALVVGYVKFVPPHLKRKKKK